MIELVVIREVTTPKNYQKNLPCFQLHFKAHFSSGFLTHKFTYFVESNEFAFLPGIVFGVPTPKLGAETVTHFFQSGSPPL